MAAPAAAVVATSAAPAAASASSAPAAIQGSGAAAPVASPPVAPAQRRYYTLVGPLHHLQDIRGQPGWPCHPRGPVLQAQGSHPPQDPGCHPHHLIRASLGPRTYPLHPLSGDLTSITGASREIRTAVRDICMGRFTTISWHLPRTRSSETQCSSCRDTT